MLFFFTLQGHQKKTGRTGPREYEDIIAEKLPSLGKETVIKVQKAQCCIQPKHIVIKMMKIKYKQRILKAASEKCNK